MQIQPIHIENHTGDSGGVVHIGTELDSRYSRESPKNEERGHK